MVRYVVPLQSSQPASPGVYVGVVELNGRSVITVIPVGSFEPPGGGGGGVVTVTVALPL
jgi:hypothetical protein